MSRIDDAVEALRGVLAGAEPGQRLGTKDELQARAGVSKGTFAEALRLLRASGAVELRPGPGGGLFAGAPTPVARLGNSLLALDAAAADVGEAVRIRDALDPLLVEDAVAHGTPAGYAELRAALARMEAAVADPEEFVRANWELHRRIAELSPNALLRSIYLSLLDIVEEHTTAVLPAPEEPLAPYVRRRLGVHADLVAAIESRERAEALRLTEVHRVSGGAGGDR
ncbi:FCD domain-containing protein [Brevibacterium sp. 5221]|uniref:FCD domain-containing protein n=1 Tax=Brevibacterium rongguiense TaxID=2695267 RepID=A0A6N9H4P3_9MICO|nr:FCD domain-containing protein [Brevibacterium rongguiense]MYM18801.1 FCD domain-containing protein [Brevibacterium rongguiense]